MLDYLYIHKQILNIQQKYPKYGDLISIYHTIIFIVIGLAAAYLAYKCNRQYGQLWQWIATIFAFIFSFIYLIYYFIFNIFFGFGCGIPTQQMF